MSKEEKTNVMRLLESKKIPYVSHLYEPDSTKTGVQIAEILGENPEEVYKTLVTAGKPKAYYVFVIPVAGELDLKKAAKAVGEKSLAMLPQKELLPITGYVHGGCSPIGMKKTFTTVFHISARNQQRICFSAGKVGAQVEIDTEDISKIIRAGFADVCTE